MYIYFTAYRPVYGACGLLKPCLYDTAEANIRAPWINAAVCSAAFLKRQDIIKGAPRSFVI